MLIIFAGLAPDTAASATFPKLARSYITMYSRAYDQCMTPTLSVSAPPNLPATACPATHTVTQDETVFPMSIAKLRINNTGKIILFGGGFPIGARVKIELTLRVSQNLPNRTVTYEDKTVQCGNGGFGFVAYPRDKIVGKTTLAACLGPGLSTLASKGSNIEILEAKLLDSDTGEYFGTPGISGRTAGFPAVSHGITTFMVRAVDACSSGTITVVPADPACLQANNMTDNTINFSRMKLTIDDRGKVRLHAYGLKIGEALRVKMLVRATKNAVTTNAGTQTVTFQDVVADCPTAYAFLPGIGGNIDCGNCAGVGQVTHIEACLSNNPNGNYQGLNVSNFEILDVQVVNANGNCINTTHGVCATSNSNSGYDCSPIGPGGGCNNNPGDGMGTCQVKTCTVDSDCQGGGTCDSEKLVAVPGIL
jgi:hypothetical protein